MGYHLKGYHWPLCEGPLFEGRLLTTIGHQRPSYLVRDHGDKLHELLEPVGEHGLRQGVELGALLQYLREDLHECCAGLEVAVVA